MKKKKTCFVCGKKHTFFRYLKLLLMGRWAVQLDCKICSDEEAKLFQPYLKIDEKGKEFVTLESMITVWKEMKKRHPEMKV